MEDKKKDITIHVNPMIAMSVIGLVRGYLSSLIENFEEEILKGLNADLEFAPSLHDKMKEVLDEIYEKCIAETGMRVITQGILNSKGELN